MTVRVSVRDAVDEQPFVPELPGPVPADVESRLKAIERPSRPWWWRCSGRRPAPALLPIREDDGMGNVVENWAVVDVVPLSGPAAGPAEGWLVYRVRVDAATTSGATPTC